MGYISSKFSVESIVLYSFIVRYRERLYFFSSEEAKESFTKNPKKYIAQSGTIKVCCHNTICSNGSCSHLIVAWPLSSSLVNKYLEQPGLKYGPELSCKIEA